MPNIQDILIDTFRKLLEQLTGFISSFSPAIIVLVIGSFVAKLIRKLLQKGLEKSGVDRLGDKLNQIDMVKKIGEIKFSSLIPSILYYYILLMFITIATTLMGIKALSDMIASVMILIPKLIVAAIMIFAGIMIAEALKNAVLNICKSLKIESGKLLGSIVFSFF